MYANGLGLSRFWFSKSVVGPQSGTGDADPSGSETSCWWQGTRVNDPFSHTSHLQGPTTKKGPSKKLFWSTVYHCQLSTWMEGGWKSCKYHCKFSWFFLLYRRFLRAKGIFSEVCHHLRPNSNSLQIKEPLLPLQTSLKSPAVYVMNFEQEANCQL